MQRIILDGDEVSGHLFSNLFSIMAKNVSPKQNDNEEDNSDDIRPFQLYAILFCGLIIIGAGLYLFISESYATGFSWPGKYGEGVVKNFPLMELQQ